MARDNPLWPQDDGGNTKCDGTNQEVAVLAGGGLVHPWARLLSEYTAMAVPSVSGYRAPTAYPFERSPSR